MSHEAHATGAAGASTARARLALALVLGVWFLAAALASGAGWLVPGQGQPPLALLVAVLGPLALFAAAYAYSDPFRAYVRAGDPVLLTAVQGWRILGGTFLVLMLYGLLPAAFAQPAGWGDVAVGVTAPFVAHLLATRGATRSGRLVIGWQLLGILDLVVAVGSGTTVRFTSAADAEQMIALNRLPLSLIPAFAVPLFVILHLATIIQVRALAARNEADRQPSRAVMAEVG
jgi:hypothetical protein